MNSKKSAEKHTIFTILINCALKLHTVETTTTTTYTNTTNWCLFACFLALYEHKRSRIWIQNTSWLSCQWKQLNSWILFEAKNNRWLFLQSLIFWKPTQCTILISYRIFSMYQKIQRLYIWLWWSGCLVSLYPTTN